MWHLIKRHPVSIRAEFDFVLVLTYAAPADHLKTLLPPGLQVDEWNGYGFLAIAFVQTHHLRPAILPPFLGRSFFLSGYRIFSRYRCADGRELRGLKILRSDTDRRTMRIMGNLLTHYNYQPAQVEVERSPQALSLNVTTPDHTGDIRLSASLDQPDGFLPDGSPFTNEQEARRFTGPMPYTFDYEQETHSIIRIQGVRKQWKPKLVPVTVETLRFFQQDTFPETNPVLASCFYIEDIDYMWKRGIREPLDPKMSFNESIS